MSLIAPIEVWDIVIEAYMRKGAHEAVYNAVNVAGQILGSAEAERYFGRWVCRNSKPHWLAAYAQMTSAAVALGTVEDRERAVRLANQALVEAERLAGTPEDQLVKVARALAHAGEGRRPQAERLLKAALPLRVGGEESTLAHAALAGLYLRAEKYGEALPLYAQVLRRSPGCPPEVRTAMGVCHFKLGRMDAARACFARALELDPRNADALAALAVLDLNAAQARRSPGARLAAHDRLRAALEASGHAHPLALATLAHEALREGEWEAADALAHAAAHVLGGEAGAAGAGGGAPAEVSALLARATCTRARARHALGDAPAANRLYMAVVGMASAAGGGRPPLVTHLGTAQMFLRTRNAANAVGSLEQMLAAAPGDEDVLGLLGSVYHQNPRLLPKLASHVRGLDAGKVGSARALAVVGELLALEAPGRALAAMQRGIELLHAGRGGEGAGAVDAAKLYNNAAVLHLRRGELHQARELMASAVAAAAGRGDVLVTLKFNLGVLAEAEGDLVAAAREYEGILEGLPVYADCYVRLAGMEARSRGPAAALAVLDRALAVPGLGGHVALLCGKVGALEALRRFEDAERALKDGLAANPGAAKDPHVCLLRGNLALHAIGPVRDAADEERADRLLPVAAAHYEKALKLDAHNVFAAAGLAACLAYMGEFHEAQEALTSVTEALATEDGLGAPQAVVNAGLCALAQDNTRGATKALEAALKRDLNGLDPRVALYLARALYDQDGEPGAGEGGLVETRRVLAKAIHLAPQDRKAQFDAALCMQKAATNTLAYLGRLGADKFTPREVGTVARAKEGLGRAQQLYLSLVDARKGSRRVAHELRQIDSHLPKHIQFCAESIVLAEQYERLADAALEAFREEQEALEEDRRVAELERKKRELLERKLAEAREKERLEKVEALRVRQRELAEQMRMQEASQRVDDLDGGEDRGRGKGKKKGRRDDGEDAGAEGAGADAGADGDADAGADGGADGGAEADAMREAGLLSDDEGDGGTLAGKRAREEGGDAGAAGDDELRAAGLLSDDEGDAAGGDAAAAGEEPAKRRRVIEEDDE